MGKPELFIMSKDLNKRGREVDVGQRQGPGAPRGGDGGSGQNIAHQKSQK